jgi:hypothetical protein
VLLMAGIRQGHNGRPTGLQAGRKPGPKALAAVPPLADRFEQRTLFVLSSQYVLFAAVGTGLLPKSLAGFEN